MKFDELIASMKCSTFDEANQKAIDVFNTKGGRIGKLIPVGSWILDKKEIIDSLCSWRQRTMRMFLTQFQSTYERTFNYLKNLSIQQAGRLFFLLYDNEDRLIGHVGISGVTGRKGELDNLMRGIDGGDPRLIYFSELSLLNWCFKNLDIQEIDVRVISYNWLVISLHEEVGFVFVEKNPLKKYEEDGFIFHDVVTESEANVKYGSIRLLLNKAKFFEINNWLI